MPVTPAPYTRRAAAAAIDMLCGALPLLLVSPVAFAFWASGRGDSQLAALTLLAANAALCAALYFVAQLVQALRGRRTPGRRLMGLELSGSTTRRAVRVLLSAGWLTAVIVSGLYPLILVPLVWAFVDARGRALADVLAGTEVNAVTPSSATSAQLPQDPSAPASQH